MTHRDPRSIITPDAFEVSADLIGMPLASPSRRALALLIDGVVIAILTAVTKSFALILGVVAAFFFIRAGFKRTEVKGSVFGRAMRFSVGCLGVFIALVTISLWGIFGFGFGGDDEGDANAGISSIPGLEGAGALVGGTLATIGLAEDFDGVETIEEAERVAADFVATARTGGIDEETIRSILLNLPPESEDWDPDWNDDWDSVVDGLLGDARPAGAETPSPGVADDATSAIAQEVARYSDEEALSRYLDLLRTETDQAGSSDAARLNALQERVGRVVAADTLDALASRISSLERELRSRNRALEVLGEEAVDNSGEGLFSWVRGRLDDLGFGFGWAALYMTIFLSWLKGQTVGKRMVGVRVVRLDGEPITWWIAFERVGGYAAGFATGLLGFAQVWWDANRQGIHDRIVGTVVVREGAEKVTDWEDAL